MVLDEMSHKTLVAIILPVYNGGDFLQQSVLSVLNQDFKDFEFFILDDSSTDESYSWLSSINDPRVTLLRNETNKGLFYNLNLLVQLTKAPLIKLWAQDDIMYPYCIEDFLKCFVNHPEVGYIYSARDIIDDQGNLKQKNTDDHTPSIITSAEHAQISYYGGSLAGNISNVAISRKALKKVGTFNEKMKISGDFDMLVRLAEHSPTAFIKRKLVQIRNHKGQLSRDRFYNFNHVKEDLEVYNYLNSYVSLSQQQLGRKILMKQKLIFYYTLFVQSIFIEKDLPLAKQYYRQLSSFTNFRKLTYAFILRKLKITSPGRMKLDKDF